ncbi:MULTISPECIES: glycosyltransferase family 29 protein [unclassified Leclercia]|uniref:glycosyltransferase family 29 protein n=1 Tax=unclassified Leclercia TaxID=2627398 RepID=UPI000DF374C2|nr:MULTISPECIES: glycosyltransferase family 29 protein [unclassified Leclercia]AXF66375.1 glycosyltransferase [Leclercia sp. W17]
MKYYLVSPFSNKNNGITNYVSSAHDLLLKNGIDVTVIDNHDNLKPVDLEKKIVDIIGNTASIVEIPDAWGLFYNTPTSFIRHVRLHAPSLLLQEINGITQNKQRFNRECNSARSANFVSSPSVVNSNAYNLKNIDCYSYPNPIPFSFQDCSQKDIDIIFIGRADNVKGIDLFAKILSHLPSKIRVVLIGVTAEQFECFRLKGIKCSIEILGWLNNDDKLEYLKRAKVCAITSRFESFSLVAAEAISCRCHVITWDVGGFSECYPEDLLSLINYEDIISYSATILDKLEAPLISEEKINHFINENNAKYIEAVKSIITGKIINNSFNFNNKKYTPTRENINNIYKQAVINYLENGINTFGFSMMNEHAEEMWGSLIGSVISNYTFISRKPLGYNSKFDHRFPISPNNFKVYDWRFNTRQLIDDFSKLNDPVVFVFNGNTSAFDDSIKAIKLTGNPPIVYSELGWLPQKNNIYFDSTGANYRSSIRHSSLEKLTHKYNYNSDQEVHAFSFKTVLLALQLPGDTTLQKESYPLQLLHQDLIAHIRSILPADMKLIVRKHPRDPNDYNVEFLENTIYDININSHDTLKSVDALIAVNSTIIIEALSYPINIYSLGYGLFENKGIVTECHRDKDELQEKWLNYIEFNRERRQEFLRFLRERQFSVSDFYQDKDIQKQALSLYPIVESIMNISPSSSPVILAKPTISKTDTKETKKLNALVKTKNKFRKLVRTPKKFTQDFAIKNHKKLTKVLSISPKANAWLFSGLIKPLVSKKIIGFELDKTYKTIRHIEKYIPEIAYLYYRTKWIYFGVNKDMIKFAKSASVKHLSDAMKFDIASILCESGNYNDAISIAKSCLNKQPDIFRKKQYLRLATLIYNDKNYLSSLPQDEMTYITELNNCFFHILNSRNKIETLIKNSKSNIKTIGNSPNQRGIKKGKAINNAGLVIRFNSFDTSLNRRADVGVKTDIWVKSPSFEEVERKSLSSIKSVIITGTNHLDRSPSAYDFFYDFYKNKIPATNVPQDIYQTLSRKISSPPSGGIQVLFWLKELNGRINSANIYGFSLDKKNALKGPNGEVNQKAKYSHNWDKEIEIIKKECLW